MQKDLVQRRVPNKFPSDLLANVVEREGSNQCAEEQQVPAHEECPLQNSRCLEHEEHEGEVI